MAQPYNQKYTYNIRAFTNEDEVSYYLLGCFMTDGSVDQRYKKDNKYRSVTITVKDKLWINDIKNIICKNKPIYKTKYNHYRLNITNTEIANWFVNKQCTPKKSLTLRLPNIPDVYFGDFLRGCIDGDGSITHCKYNKIKNGKTYTYQKSTCYLCSSSLGFLQDVSNYLDKFGIHHNIYEVIKQNSIIRGRIVYAKNRHWRLTINDSYCVPFLNFIYNTNCNFRMNRKYLKGQEILNFYASKKDNNLIHCKPIP